MIYISEVRVRKLPAMFREDMWQITRTDGWKDRQIYIEHRERSSRKPVVRTQGQWDFLQGMPDSRTCRPAHPLPLLDRDKAALGPRIKPSLTRTSSPETPIFPSEVIAIMTVIVKFSVKWIVHQTRSLRFIVLWLT